MKKVPFILFSLVLGLIILAGCGEWLAKREAKRDEAKKRAEALLLNEKEQANYLIVRDTLQLADIVLKAHKERRLDAKGNVYFTDRHYEIDTNKTRNLPYFNNRNFFDYYGYLLHLGKEDSLVMKPNNPTVGLGYTNYRFICYHQGIRTPLEFGIDIYNKKIIFVSQNHPADWLKDADTTTVITKQQAAEIALKEARRNEKRIHKYAVAKLVSNDPSVTLSGAGIVYGFQAEIFTEYFPIWVVAKTGEVGMSISRGRTDLWSRD